ncbi:molybdate ABC transporter permease subunit [Fictibacillus nanhaiensis]|uniref:molybdate ABC transporter permease subunit n=1 Tax=Fictibacillus nanhaiensis TaxID=742169 RepID=UPI002E1E8A17|nr:molybdate ABC transporter permease subunit [Fictibacillus nanhaiensis]
MAIDFWSPVKLSLGIAVTASLIVILAGLFFGRIMSHQRFKGKTLIETLFLLPLVLPPTVVGFLLIVLFGRNGPGGKLVDWLFNQPILFTWWAAVIAAAVVAFPLMYQSAKAGFESIDADIENAARVDGANEWDVLLKISVPLSLRAITSGAILSFARALGEFGATLMFAGNIPGKTQTISTAIYIAIESGQMDLAWMWVGSVIGISFLMLIAVNRIRT